MAELIFIPAASGGGPPGAARQAFEWNANGDLVAFDIEPASFDGEPASDPALAGPGPFDTQREVTAAASIASLNLSQRVPGTAPDVTEVAFYRIRAGTVALLGTASLNNASQFQSASTAPAVSDLSPGDILFVSFVEVPTAGLEAADLNA
jgi:hypothetical protein